MMCPFRERARRVPASAGESGSSAAAEQVNERHEEGGADDRPENRENLPGDMEHDRLRELHLAGDPGAEERADEPENDGDEEAASSAASDGAANGTADRRDEDQKEDSRYGDHAGPLHFSSTGLRDEIRFG